MAENTPSIKTLWQALKKYISLNVANIKLSATEKLTLFFAAVAFGVVALVLIAIVMVFLSMAMCEILSQSMSAQNVYLIMAAFYLLLLVIIGALRKVLFLNPIARFLSKIMLNPPKEKE